MAKARATARACAVLCFGAVVSLSGETFGQSTRESPSRPPPPPLVQEPVVKPDATSRSSKAAAYAFGGVAIVGAGVGLFFGALAMAKKSEFDRTPTRDRADSAEHYALVTDLALGVAITAGVTSAVLFLRGGSRQETKVGEVRIGSSRRLVLAPALLRDGGGVFGSIRF